MPYVGNTFSERRSVSLLAHFVSRPGVHDEGGGLQTL